MNVLMRSECSATTLRAAKAGGSSGRQARDEQEVRQEVRMQQTQGGCKLSM